MVRIRKGTQIMEVPKSAFYNFYENAGWEMEETSFGTDDEGWDEAIDEYSEKPLSQMNNTELIEKAISLGLEIDGNATNKQLREMIRGASR